MSKRKKKGGEEEQCTYKPMCKCTRAFLSIKQPHFLPSIFFPFWGELFGGPGKKTLGSQHLFSSLFTQPNTLQENFHFHFLSKKKFYLPYFTYVKRTFQFVDKNHLEGTFIYLYVQYFNLCLQKNMVVISLSTKGFNHQHQPLMKVPSRTDFQFGFI